MSELQITTTKPTINARELHEKLKVSTRYDMWIGRRIKKYGFISGQDFCTILGESTGGRKSVEYFITIGMAKELCMLDDTEIGRRIRQEYIKLENEVYNRDIRRMAGMEVRKSLVEKIDDSGENERMHGFAYPTYTKMAYKLAGITYEKRDNFRDTLTAEQLARVETVEKLIDGMLSLGKKYDEIKTSLSMVISVPKS